MKKYIPYIAAALIGFHLRWIASALNGWSYSMNGVDLLNAILCVIMVWSFIGAFLPKKKKAAPERQFGKRQTKLTTCPLYHGRKEKSSERYI